MMDKKIKLLINKTESLLKAIKENQSELWQTDLEYTIDCVIWDECEINHNYPNDDDIEYYSGISSKISDVNDIIKEIKKGDK